MKKIGRGLFSTAYLNKDNKVELFTFDPIKEAYYLYGQNNPFVPTIYNRETLEKERYGRIEEKYTMKYYNQPRSLKKNLKPSHWKVYQELRKVFMSGENRGYHQLQKSFGNLDIHWTQKDLLLDMLADVSNYDFDIIMEISPRNVAVENGTLILLDIFFSPRLANKIRKEQFEKRRAKRRYQAAGAGYQVFQQFQVG